MNSTSFTNLKLDPKILRAIEDEGYSEPTPIQLAAIPELLAGKDLLATAQTGTGKTAAFSLPILQMLNSRQERDAIGALILTPTRELALQIDESLRHYGRHLSLRSAVVLGGVPSGAQIRALRQNPDILVATPGRLLDLMNQGHARLDRVSMLVLDEADRMLDIGFRPDIEKILRRCPKQRQTLLLSATIDKGVERLAKSYMVDPEILDFSPSTKAPDTIEQHYFTVEEMRKFDLLLRLLDREDPEQAIVFCRTKRGTDRVERKLSQKMKGVACIHGDMQQTARDRVMQSFRDAKVRILVATDVVGRGIDVTNISHIINYDMPQSSDDYVHRVGRTGRMGREGVAYSFVTPEQGIELTRIEILINTLLKRDEMEGFQAVAQAAPPQEVTADGPPEEKKPAPPGQRPRRRHRRGL